MHALLFLSFTPSLRPKNLGIMFIGTMLKMDGIFLVGRTMRVWHTTGGFLCFRFVLLRFNEVRDATLHIFCASPSFEISWASKTKQLPHFPCTLGSCAAFGKLPAALGFGEGFLTRCFLFTAPSLPPSSSSSSTSFSAYNSPAHSESHCNIRHRCLMFLYNASHFSNHILVLLFSAGLSE